jgi:sterol desaturase/sphingolipid hydroxylase (fatty acid hydroxylase superfamily)
VNRPWAILPADNLSGEPTILNQPRVTRSMLFAVGAIAAAAIFAALVAARWQSALRLETWTIEVAAVKWRAGQLLLITAIVIVVELFFLSWEKTTVFRVFVRRSRSAITDLAFAFLTFSSFKWLADYAFSLGVALAAVKLGDALATRVGWMRWEMPTDGFFAVVGAFAVYYLMSTFVGYWQHRLMHWRWFWQLHRFHHSATDFNVFTGFRTNPAEMISNLIPALSPLVFLKVPDAGLFAAFTFVNLLLGQFQHTELPWSFGWVGRWVVTPPQMHQIHHSIDEEHRDKNFSNCPLWDQLFGTWYGGPNRPSAYGIPDPAHVERPATQWLIDIWVFYRDVGRSLVAWSKPTQARNALTQSVSADADRPASIIAAE